MKIAKEGKGFIHANSKSFDESKNLPLNEVRIILVGDGGAGKTSLAKRLLGKHFNQNESQTHGINIDHLWLKQGCCETTQIKNRRCRFSTHPPGPYEPGSGCNKM